MDDKARVMTAGSKTSIIERKRKQIWKHTTNGHGHGRPPKAKRQRIDDNVVKAQTVEIERLKRENEMLKKEIVLDAKVKDMSDSELKGYENKLKQQLKDIAREITKVYEQKSLRKIDS